MQRIKSLVTQLLNAAVRSYIKRNKIKVIAVAGSVGKTSTVSAIRTVLAQKYRVHQPATAYNTTKSVHVEIFDLPFATSLAGWAVTSVRVLFKSLGRSPYEVLVVEIGTDHPGELQEFAWLKPDMAVLTAIVPEHMEFFKTIEAVAAEELSVALFCDRLFCDAHTVENRFITDSVMPKVTWYGQGTNFEVSDYKLASGKATVTVKLRQELLSNIPVQVVGMHSTDALMAAAAIGVACNLSLNEISRGLQTVVPVKGRMQLLAGIRSSTLLDDSYNASPEAAKAALDVLYGLEVPQRVAVLGMMNEMGEYSEYAHREVGAYCNPDKLDLVLTVGADANEYLATEAELQGCRVERFTSPYAAGRYLTEQLQAHAAVLFKGSQNSVFVEESVKILLADPADADRLVRQSSFWKRRKAEQFEDITVV